MNRKKFFKLLTCAILAPVAAAKAFGKRRFNFCGRMTNGICIVNPDALARIDIGDSEEPDIYPDPNTYPEPNIYPEKFRTEAYIWNEKENRWKPYEIK